ncbi:ATP-binding protein [Parabacteroides sp. AM08-6]|uniref:AAA family ATPase n=1 Tax=Parabacteroides sp. AM08-6 TaxID=2292053 RepID=UPI000F006A41|nr:ATP-binding protein [Parabacteroides sp. AM08-6]RHJ78548.1 ATPase [Parabacteroides sp. AM08-6]
MTILNNPFVTSGYISPEYFCDREKETETLLRWLVNENNVAIISTRRMGKTGLIEHCFRQPAVKEQYYTFLIDIYASKTLRDFVFQLGKSILNTLKPKGRKAWELFLNTLVSVRAGFSLDLSGLPSWNIELGDIKSPAVTLDEIFHYLEQADKPCIVAIDEFQQIASYPEKNMEATLRTHIQHCRNTRFIFAGSQRHLMGEMFISPARPFYQSVSIMHLKAIEEEAYTEFASSHFLSFGKKIETEVIHSLYERFEGITWYIQKLLNVLFAMTPKGETCNTSMVNTALEFVVDSYSFTYSELLYQLPEKQKELLVAICKEGHATALTSGKFIHRYSLPSASSVQSALKGLLEKDFITREGNTFQVYDRFFAEWLRRSF